MDNRDKYKKQLENINHLSLHELQGRFKELYGFETSQSNIRTLRNRLIYKIQEIYFGGLSPNEYEQISELFNKVNKIQKGQQDMKKIKIVPGTRFSRIWKGQIHEVITDNNCKFIYRGQTYRSLSSIAEVITGTHWNGRRFFGV